MKQKNYTKVIFHITPDRGIDCILGTPWCKLAEPTFAWNTMQTIFSVKKEETNTILSKIIQY
jgi:hypothetical protein